MVVSNPKNDGKHSTLLKRYEAMEGAILRMQEDMKTVLLSFEGTNFIANLDKTLDLLNKSRHNLGLAYRLALYRRNKRLIQKFRTLSVSSKRLSHLNDTTGGFQVYCLKIMKTVDKLWKRLSELKRANLNDLQAKHDDFQKVLRTIYTSKKVKQVGLLFTLAKQILD